MHELSIAMGIVEAAVEEARQRNVQVSAVHLRLGALSAMENVVSRKDSDAATAAVSGGSAGRGFGD